MPKYLKIILLLTVFVFSILLALKFWNKESYAEKALHLLNSKFGKETVTNGSDTHSMNQTELLKLYYLQHKQALIAEDNAKKTLEKNLLLRMLQYADSLGLDSKDYHEKYLKNFESHLNNPNYSYEENLVQTEVVFADAAISFLFDVAYGKDIPELEYNGIKPFIDSARITNALQQVISTKQWHNVLDTLEPKIPEYVKLKNYYNYLRIYIENNPQIDTLKCTAENNSIVTKKLFALQFATENTTQDSTFYNALIQFQTSIGIVPSGKLDKRTLEELNTPLSFRVQQLKQSLNCWRWTGRVAEKKFILVNIPAATLRIVQRDSTSEINMRVIVGKEQTRTPIFTAYISKIVTYPYWFPTYNIASKEILPKVKKDISYLAKNDFAVLDKKGNEVDPASINWQNISPRNLPYTFRQGTGCDNSLGVMKFDLNSPFSIYLHDTNRRDLFTKNDRHLSHGCVRLEKPFLLASILLGDSVNTAYLNECLKNEKPRDIKLPQKFPVLLFYLTADINQQGKLQFFKDVYKKI
ncbi:MAG: L,D-transpeptidase family protein [Chitinophagales bacterium]|nr:L,D-transpeptidase family protein [Chitinophagales bacterium]OJV29802.1 MAG: hypothetical protein BGO32_11675 [Bacteroidetes bacterium 37-13]HRN94628.1 L,D-transpeptidase family protein [Chitinophagales bacterium]HRP38951.1 L,D-transpeptidase family protein [Chitinophagales bacterium]